MHWPVPFRAFSNHAQISSSIRFPFSLFISSCPLYPTPSPASDLDSAQAALASALAERDDALRAAAEQAQHAGRELGTRIAKKKKKITHLEFDRYFALDFARLRTLLLLTLLSFSLMTVVINIFSSSSFLFRGRETAHCSCRRKSPNQGMPIARPE